MNFLIQWCPPFGNSIPPSPAIKTITAKLGALNKAVKILLCPPWMRAHQEESEGKETRQCGDRAWETHPLSFPLPLSSPGGLTATILAS